MNTLDGKLLVDKGRDLLYEMWRVVVPFTMEINFSSKVYYKSLLKWLHEAKPIDLYFDAGYANNCTIMQLQTKDKMTSIRGISLT